MIHTDGHAALCDFGLSSIIARATHNNVGERVTAMSDTQTTLRYVTSGNIATPRYLAPEQLSSDDAKPTFAADVYAFACTLAEVCGQFTRIFSTTHTPN